MNEDVEFLDPEDPRRKLTVPGPDPTLSETDEFLKRKWLENRPNMTVCFRGEPIGVLPRDPVYLNCILGPQSIAYGTDFFYHSLLS